MDDIRDGATANFPAVRCSSLYFWYAYIEIDKSYTLKYRGSDIGDYYQMSLIPYCSAFTVDKTMRRLVNRVKGDVNFTCEILNEPELLEKITQ